jgi:hypothetical protein
MDTDMPPRCPSTIPIPLHSYPISFDGLPLTLESALVPNDASQACYQQCSALITNRTTRWLSQNGVLPEPLAWVYNTARSDLLAAEAFCAFASSASVSDATKQLVFVLYWRGLDRSRRTTHTVRASNQLTTLMQTQCSKSSHWKGLDECLSTWAAMEAYVAAQRSPTHVCMGSSKRTRDSSARWMSYKQLLLELGLGVRPRLRQFVAKVLALQLTDQSRAPKYVRVK